MRRWLAASVVLLVLIVVFAAVFGGKAYQDQRAAEARAAQSYPAATVSTAAARQASWNAEVRAVGTLRAVSGTEITAQIAGNVTHIAFASGAHVKHGDLLVQLDDSTQRAALHSDQAQLQLAQANLARARNLVASHAVSQESLQAAEKDFGVARAAVENDQAVIAKLRITAPFSGVLGIREVSLGQYVSPGTAIVSLQQWQPLLLDFSLPQEALAQVGNGQKVRFDTSARPRQTFAGKVTAVDSEVDPQTRNIRVQATLDNAHALLRPGLFGHVTLALGHAMSGTAVPQTALTYSTFGDSVYVVADGAHGGKVAHAKVVHVLNRRDGEVLLAEADLAPGATVVTAGQNKLRDGAAVAIDNSVQP